MEQQQMLNTIIPIDQQFFELLTRMKLQMNHPIELFIVELEQLQDRLHRWIDNTINDDNDTYDTQLAQRFFELQEKERKNISDILYNHFGQTLFSFMLGIDLLEKYDLDQMIKDHLIAMKEQAYIASIQIKDLANKLYPVPLCDLGLVPATRSLLNALQDHNNIPIECKIKEGELELLPITSLFVYRIIESIMGYILQHQYIDHIKINISFNRMDFGLQFTITYSQETERVGSVKNLDYYEILQRVEVIGGTIAIHNVKAMTTIEFSVPVVESV